MKYTFKEIMNAEIYSNTRVMVVTGKYNWFNNMVCDTLKTISRSEDTYFNESIGLDDEFGIAEDEEIEQSGNSVDFNTFMEVVGVSSVNGKWFCKVDYASLTKKQIETLLKYIKEPSENGVLVVVSTEWKDYRELLKNRALSFSKVSHLIQLNFANRTVLKSIVKQCFLEKGVEIDQSALEIFITRMSNAYEKYEETIDKIVEMHGAKELSAKEIKSYMKGIEYFILDDFMTELTKPMSSSKSNNKKILRIMASLIDDNGAKGLVYQVLKKIDEYIEYRLLINTGYIPIGINYFFKDILKNLPDSKKYEKESEWSFRKKADIASRTSLRDWEYMKLILSRAIENNQVSDDIMEMKCKKALYELCTRTVMFPSRINNALKIDNVLKKSLNNLDNIKYDEEALAKIGQLEKEIENEDLNSEDDSYIGIGEMEKTIENMEDNEKDYIEKYLSSIESEVN